MHLCTCVSCLFPDGSAVSKLPAWPNTRAISISDTCVVVMPCMQAGEGGGSMIEQAVSTSTGSGRSGGSSGHYETTSYCSTGGTGFRACRSSCKVLPPWKTNGGHSYGSSPSAHPGRHHHSTGRRRTPALKRKPRWEPEPEPEPELEKLTVS